MERFPSASLGIRTPDVPLGERSSTTSASQHSVGGILSEISVIATCSQATPNVPGRQSQKAPETTPKHCRSQRSPNIGGGQVGLILVTANTAYGKVEETPDSETSERVGLTPGWEVTGFESVKVKETTTYAGTASSTWKSNVPDDGDHTPDALMFTAPMAFSGSNWLLGSELSVRPLICHCVEGPAGKSAQNNTDSSFFPEGRVVLSNIWKNNARVDWHELCPDSEVEVLHGKRASSFEPHSYPSSTVQISEHPSLSKTLPSSHSSSPSTRPSPQWVWHSRRRGPNERNIVATAPVPFSLSAASAICTDRPARIKTTLLISSPRRGFAVLVTVPLRSVVLRAHGFSSIVSSCCPL
eukprot:1319990-Rhodomonas_salina.1